MPHRTRYNPRPVSVPFMREVWQHVSANPLHSPLTLARVLHTSRYRCYRALNRLVQIGYIQKPVRGALIVCIPFGKVAD